MSSSRSPRRRGPSAGLMSCFARSIDQGVTGHRPGPLPARRHDLPPRAGAGRSPDGTLYVTWFDGTDGQILIARSEDGGLTFANPVSGGGAVISTGLFDSVGLKGGGTAFSFPDLATDAQGNLYLAYPGWVVGQRADIFLVRSTDMGLTWTNPALVNDDGTDSDQWLPAVAVAANGVVGVMFYDRRNDTGIGNTDVYLAQSFDGGLTFLPNRRVTSVSFPPTFQFDPNGTTFPVDDRNQMAAEGNQFSMVWADNRDLVGVRNDPNVYFARGRVSALFR